MKAIFRNLKEIDMEADKDVITDLCPLLRIPYLQMSPNTVSLTQM